MDYLSNDGVTIGIPVYNEAEYLHETITSAINQTYKNINIIISDNNSTDNSYLIAQEFADKYCNVSVIKHNENIGISNNFKYSLDNAITEYFMWLGAHDLISKTYVEDSVLYLKNNKEVALVYHNAVFFNGDTTNFIEGANSDIDTSGLNIESRMLKVIRNLSRCTMIYGVFRTEILKKLPLINMVGADNLILFATAEMGHIKNINKLGFYRRDVHVFENRDETLLRYQKFQMYIAVDNNPYALFIFNHLKYILFSRNLNVVSKLKLILKLINHFSNIFNVTGKQLLKQCFIKT